MTTLRFGLSCYASFCFLVTAACTPATPLASSSGRPLSPSVNGVQNTSESERLKASLLEIVYAASGQIPESPEVTAISDQHTLQISENPENTAFQVKSEGAIYTPVAPESLEILLQKKGLYTSDNLITISLSDGDIEQLKSRFQSELKRVVGTQPFSHYGLSLIKKGPAWFMSCILISEVVRFDQPLAMSYPSPTTVNFVGQITMSGFAHPKVLITQPDGHVLEVAKRSTGQDFNTPLELKQTGLYSIEVDVEGPFGPQPACNFIVAVGVPFPESLNKKTVAAQNIENIETAQAELLQRLNADRKTFGLNPLKAHSLLNVVSQAHSQDMVDNGFVGHNSPTQGTPQEQAFAFKLSANVAQNVAVNSTLAQAHEKLMSSPGHRQTLLSPEYTHAGFGIAANSEGQLYITQNFIEEKFVLDALPSQVKVSQSFDIQGTAVESGVVGVFINQTQHHVSSVKAGERFRLPIRIETLGKQRLLIGFSPTQEATQLKVYNLWDLDVTP